LQGPLRGHIEAILSMRWRHKRMTYAEIARQLKAEHGIAVHRSTVFRVYKRAQNSLRAIRSGSDSPISNASAAEVAGNRLCRGVLQVEQAKKPTKEGYVKRGNAPLHRRIRF
jgi:hypothetical protein